MIELHSAPVVLPICAPPIHDGAVVVRDDQIVLVGRRADALRQHPAAPERRWQGVLTPGLVNAHTHLNYTAYADFHDNGLPFFQWILGFAARNQQMKDDDWRASARAGAHELLTHGVTAAADVVTNAAALTTLHDENLAGIAYFELVAVDAARWADQRATWLAALSETSHAPLGVSPHTVYTLSTGVLHELALIANKRGLRLHPHAAETAHELEFTLTGTGPFADACARYNLQCELLGTGSGRTPIGELDAAGLLGPTTHIAHGVHVNADDRRLLRERGTAVALCPRSNERLEVGEAPIAAYRAEGNPIAIGTDSRASAPDLDLLDDVAAARRIALKQGSPEPGLDEWLIHAATLGGARAMGLPHVGELRPGARADLAVFEVPVSDNPYAALAADGAGTCIGTVLAGRVVHAR